MVQTTTDTIAIRPVDVRIQPSSVRAGGSFTITVKLEDFVPPGKRVVLRLAYGRVLRAAPKLTLEPLDIGYLDPDTHVSFLVLEHPQQEVQTAPVRILPNPSQRPQVPAVTLPEHLMVTAVVEQEPLMHCSQILHVSPPV